jgi:hypothetical protein
MATMRNFEIVSEKFNVMGMCSSRNYAHKLIINYMSLLMYGSFKQQKLCT